MDAMLQKMICVEGYKAFHGKMKVCVRGNVCWHEMVITGDWLYRPDTDCWYNGGSSYPADFCIVLEVE